MAVLASERIRHIGCFICCGGGGACAAWLLKSFELRSCIQRPSVLDVCQFLKENQTVVMYYSCVRVFWFRWKVWWGYAAMGVVCVMFCGPGVCQSYSSNCSRAL